ncbi:MAG: hypothetical protein ACI9OO_001449 [Bacteroidia bacterium]|jgi:hypothetical protein
MFSLLRTRRSSLLLAALLSLTLLASSVLSAHVHKDGLPHYSDCDTCLQLGGLDCISKQGNHLALIAPQGTRPTAHTALSLTTHACPFQARAPPSLS